MENPNDLNIPHLSRRDFLKAGVSTAAVLSIPPIAGCGNGDSGLGEIPGKRTIDSAIFAIPEDRGKIPVAGDPSRILLKNGFIVDGSGSKGVVGDLLIKDREIEMVTPKEIVCDCPLIDCTQKVIAPGFIDAHSHMDLVLPARDRQALKLPFTEQGITTMVAGNCGYGMAAFVKDSPHHDLIAKKMGRLCDITWTTYGEYFDLLEQTPLTHNIATLAGHGTTRTSMRGYDPSPLNADEVKQMRYLLDQAMEEGALGVSLGLQYEPGIFATLDEIRAVARAVKGKDRIMTSHMKAYSKISGTYPMSPFGRAHNLLAIDDMLKVTRDTGVRMQLSHLIFVGAKTWDTCGEALNLVDWARSSGLDLMFDTYAYHCGYSVINVFYPEKFLAQVPQVYKNSWEMLKLRAQLELMVALLGFGYQDIQVLNTLNPELAEFNGMFLKDMAKQRNMSQFDNFVDVTKKSLGRALVLNHRYSSLENVKDLMRHPSSLFMTDALVFEQGAQNPGSFGCYPRFLQFARDFNFIRLEECVRKMSGAVADRFRLRRRGYLKPGFFADVTVFDWQNIMDNNTQTETAMRPSGIDHVFINGRKVLSNGRAHESAAPGMVLRA